MVARWTRPLLSFRARRVSLHLGAPVGRTPGAGWRAPRGATLSCSALVAGRNARPPDRPLGCTWPAGICTPRTDREHLASGSSRARAMKRLSIVVIARDEGAELRRTVENLRDTLPEGSEIVVVDDGSRDGCARFLNGRRNGIRLVRTAGLGVARARNLGSKHA